MERCHQVKARLLAVGLLVTAASAAGADSAGNAVPEFAVTDEGFRIVGTQSAAQSRAEQMSARDLGGHSGRVVSVAFSPDGRTLASGSADKTVKLWDAASGRLLRTLTGHPWPVVSVAFSPDSRTLVSGGVYDIMFWDVASGEMQRNLRALESRVAPLGPVAFSPDGRTLAAGGDDGVIRLWDAESGGLQRNLEGHGDKVWSVVFSPDSRILASGGNDRTVKLWNAIDGRLLHTLRRHADSINSVAFSPDGGTLVSSGVGSETINLWNTESGMLQRTLAGHRGGYVWSVAFSPNGRTVASGSRDETVNLWDVGSGELLRALDGHTDDVLSVAFSPNGRVLASGGSDGVVKLWTIKPNDPEALQDAIKANLARRQAEHGLDLIPEPSLPPEQVLERSPFETLTEFDERVERNWEAWRRQVERIQEEYRREVAARNQRVGDYESRLAEYRRQALAQSFAEVYGQPVLALIKDDGMIRNDPETNTLYTELTFRGVEPGDLRRTVAIQFRDNETGQRVSEALADGKLPATVYFTVSGDEGEEFALQEVGINMGRGRYTGVPSQTDFRSERIVVSVGGEQGIQPEYQDSVIEGRAFRAALASGPDTSNDDIPSLLARAEEVPIDESKWLFVIGIEDYRNVDDILYSRRSADWFARVATKTLGIAEGQRRVLLDDGASGYAIEDQLEEMLGLVEEGETVYFYYSGHGIPAPTQDNEPYILPVDVLQEYVHEREEHQVRSIYKQLNESKAGQVFVFMDSCFTGGADGRSLYGGEVAASRLRPKRFEAEVDGKLAILTAGTEDQYSWAFEERRHRLFSYYLMRAMLDGLREAGPLADRVSAQVYEKSRGRGRSRLQEPHFEGNRDLVM